MTKMAKFEWDPVKAPEFACWMYDRNSQGWYVKGMGVPTGAGTVRYTFTYREDQSHDDVDEARGQSA